MNTESPNGTCQDRPLVDCHMDERPARGRQPASVISLNAVDLYCGIGGWSLGLTLAGVNVIEGFDRLPAAIDTYAKNLAHPARRCDIRHMDASTLPTNIDIVVGSPPCTEFSYSNRGGSGDLAEGMSDLKAFLSVVKHVKPRYWAMENVPRVAGILRRAFGPHGELAEFSDLVDHIEIVDFSHFGLPQRRRRCIAGRFPYQLLMSYTNSIATRSLGDVLDAFQSSGFSDFLFGEHVPYDLLSDHVVENSLTDEEVRLNLEAKTRHPIYNEMRFPDEVERPARTVTATCTKVSRESIVIQTPGQHGRYRRLTVRERACLQGFPARFGVFSNSYSSKIRLVGNALPPLFSYYVGAAMLGVETVRLRHPSECALPPLSVQIPPTTTPKAARHSYPLTRRFRVAIPELRFKSGIRFQLSNRFIDGNPEWYVDFRFGNPKDIRVLDLTDELWLPLKATRLGVRVSTTLDDVGQTLKAWLDNDDPHGVLQRVWSHKASGVGPFEVVDELGQLAEQTTQLIEGSVPSLRWRKVRSLFAHSLQPGQTLLNEGKLREQRSRILAGIAVGCWFNRLLRR